MDIIIRNCTPDDAPDLARINRERMGYDYSEADTREKLIKLIGRSGDRIFVADDGGRAVGYVHAEEYDVIYAPTMVNIMGIAVDVNYARRGIGRMLLSAAEKWASDIGAAGIRLVSGAERAQAHMFYEMCGYKRNKTQLNFRKSIRPDSGK